MPHLTPLRDGAQCPRPHAATLPRHARVSRAAQSLNGSGHACSFIPVAGCIISTFPIGFVALTEYGFLKLALVILMVFGVHVVGAPCSAVMLLELDALSSCPYN